MADHCMTILSREHRFIFVHLHKCGGTSVERAYDKVSHWSDVIIGSTDVGSMIQPSYLERFGLGKHSTVMQIVESIGPEMYQKMAVFALVRDPFSVTESFFRWIQGMFRHTARKLGTDIDSLRRSILIGDDRAQQIHFASWGSAQAFAAHGDFRGFTAYCLENQCLPQKAMADRLAVGTEFEPVHIHSLTQIDRFWLALEAHLGRSLEHVHVNRSRPCADFDWPEEHVRAIRDLFARDVEVFDFPDHPDAR